MRILLVLMLASCATLKDDKHIEIRCSECKDLEIIVDEDHTAKETTVGIPIQ
jgi:hypothetical protein